MRNQQPGDFPSENTRGHALATAIALRDCSLRTQTSPATRRACRTVMREQAIKWRRPPSAGNGSGHVH